MTKYVNITPRKRRGLRLDPEDGLGQLAWKERTTGIQVKQGAQERALFKWAFLYDPYLPLLSPAWVSPKLRACPLNLFQSLHLSSTLPMKRRYLFTNYGIPEHIYACIWGKWMSELNKPYIRKASLNLRNWNFFLISYFCFLTWCLQL